MARQLNSAGIEDIKDFGKVKKENIQDVALVQEYASQGEYEPSTPTGRYYYADFETGEKKFVDPKDVTFYQDFDPDSSSYYQRPFAKISQGTTEVWGNKKTQQAIFDDYGGSGDFFSGTYHGHGRTNYGVKFTADGTPYFYTQFGGDTSDRGDIIPIVALGLSIFAPGIGTAIGTALGATGVTASVIGSAIVQGTMSELSGGDFLDGAIKGAITAGVAPVVSNTIGSAVADAMGDSVFKNLVTNAVNSASTSAITAGLTGNGDIADAALKSALLSVSNTVGQELGTSYQYGTSPFTEQNQTLLAQDRGLSSAGELGGKLGVAAGKIVSGADVGQVLTSTIISEATKGITDTLKSTVKDALKDNPVKVSDASDVVADAVNVADATDITDVDVPGMSDLLNIINGPAGTQLASTDNDAALQAIDDSRNASAADDALLGLSSAEVGQGEEDAINQANLDALEDLSSAEVGQGEEDAIDQANLDALGDLSSAAIGQGEEDAIDQANLDALLGLSSAEIGQGEEDAIDRANLDALGDLSSAEVGQGEVDAINRNALEDLSSAEVGQGEVDAINYDKLLDLSSAEVGEDEKKAVDDALKTDITTTTGGGVGVGAGLSPPLLQPRKPILKNKIKMQYFIDALIKFIY